MLTLCRAFCYLVGQDFGNGRLAASHRQRLYRTQQCGGLFVAPFSCSLIWNKQSQQPAGSALSRSCAERCEIQFRQFQVAIVARPMPLVLPLSLSHWPFCVPLPLPLPGCPFSLLRPFGACDCDCDGNGNGNSWWWWWLLLWATDRLLASVWTSDTN